MSHPVISAKHVEECPVQKKGCPAAPLPFTSLYFLFSWSILTPLIISPTLLAFNIIYVPMIPNIYFQHLLTLELQIHTQQPPGLSAWLCTRHLKLTLCKWTPVLASPHAFPVTRRLHHPSKCSGHQNMELICTAFFLSSSTYRLCSCRDPESDHHSLPQHCPLLQATVASLRGHCHRLHLGSASALAR